MVVRGEATISYTDFKLLNDTIEDDDEDITIVMTTHDPNLMELGDEVFELSDGIVI